jgi:subtilase family serine protease
MFLRRRLQQMCMSLGTCTLMVSSGLAASSIQSTNLGAEDQSKPISVTVWLNLHNKVALDAMVQGMYDKTSPNYHKFLTMKEFKTQFAPTAKDAATVRDFLTTHNMKVTSIDRNNHFVVAQGSVGDAQTAFQTKINRMMINGVAHHVNATPPAIAGPAAALVSTVQGLSDLNYHAPAST